MTLPLLEEIREQPGLLSRVLAGCRPELSRHAREVRAGGLHFVGCGDMYFAAAQTCELARELFGLDARAWRSMDVRWAARHFAPEDLVVCASVSGRTPRTVEAALLARRAGARVLAITDNPGAPLDEAVEACVILGTAPPEELERHAYAGYRNHLAQTQTFTAVLAAELLLCALMADDLQALSDLSERLAQHVPALEQAAGSLSGDFLEGGGRLLVLGSGPHLPMAHYGAAKFLEFAVPAQAQCLEEANHLDCFVADERTRAVFLAADAPASDRAREIVAPWSELGVQSLVLASADSVEALSWVLPQASLLETLFMECFALLTLNRIFSRASIYCVHLAIPAQEHVVALTTGQDVVVTASE